MPWDQGPGVWCPGALVPGFPSKAGVRSPPRPHAKNDVAECQRDIGQDVSTCRGRFPTGILDTTNLFVEETKCHHTYVFNQQTRPERIPAFLHRVLPGD